VTGLPYTCRQVRRPWALRALCLQNPQSPRALWPQRPWALRALYRALRGPTGLPYTWAYPTLVGRYGARGHLGRYIDRCKDRPTYPILARAGRPTLHLPAGTAPVGATGTILTAARTDRPTLHSRRKTERLKTGAGWAADLPYTSPLPGQSGGRGQVRSAYPTPPAPKAAERFPLRHPLYPPAVRGKVREI
jgi:hypothetical protein